MRRGNPGFISWKKNITLFLPLLLSITMSFGATLPSMTKHQILHTFVNKTTTSIPTDNLNGRDINSTFLMFMDNKGNVWGKLSQKPANQPQTDKGIYFIQDNGVVNVTWQNWDDKKKLCFNIFETKNAYITVDCGKVFHSVFMKDAIRPGNQLN